jgi:hypothetical protein
MSTSQPQEQSKQEKTNITERILLLKKNYKLKLKAFLKIMINLIDFKKNRQKD